MCQKYRELFDRPAIAQALTNDREHLLSELEEYLYKVKSPASNIECGVLVITLELVFDSGSF